MRQDWRIDLSAVSSLISILTGIGLMILDIINLKQDPKFSSYIKRAALKGGLLSFKPTCQRLPQLIYIAFSPDAREDIRRIDGGIGTVTPGGHCRRHQSGLSNLHPGIRCSALPDGIARGALASRLSISSCGIAAILTADK